MRKIGRIAGVVLAAVMLAGCAGGVYRTYYETGVQASVSRGWTVTDVRVVVPEELTVSEARTYVPDADIVWREDPPGDRKAQIAKILREAVLRAAAPLDGPRPVRIELSVARFHALTFEAENASVNGGVHNVDFTLQVVDARTGAILAGPEFIEAATPAFSGAEAITRRLQGETQKSVISRHVAATVAGWLGIGPDVRGEFSRWGD